MPQFASGYWTDLNFYRQIPLFELCLIKGRLPTVWNISLSPKNIATVIIILSFFFSLLDEIILLALKKCLIFHNLYHLKETSYMTRKKICIQKEQIMCFIGGWGRGAGGGW